MNMKYGAQNYKVNRGWLFVEDILKFILKMNIRT